MYPEEEKRSEVLDNQESDTTTDYISAINELKKNSVAREKYDQLLDENKKLIQNLVNGQTVEPEVQKTPVDVQALRNDLFKENNDLSNLEFVQKSLELRDAILETEGQDIFVANGHKLTATQADYDAAEKVAQVFRECIEYANGDSEIFTNELMRRTNDVHIPTRKR